MCSAARRSSAWRRRLGNVSTSQRTTRVIEHRLFSRSAPPLRGSGCGSRCPLWVSLKTWRRSPTRSHSPGDNRVVMSVVSPFVAVSQRAATPVARARCLRTFHRSPGIGHPFQRSRIPGGGPLDHMRRIRACRGSGRQHIPQLTACLSSMGVHVDVSLCRVVVTQLATQLVGHPLRTDSWEDPQGDSPTPLQPVKSPASQYRSRASGRARGVGLPRSASEGGRCVVLLLLARSSACSSWPVGGPRR